jgi:hypothetical protein
LPQGGINRNREISGLVFVLSRIPEQVREIVDTELHIPLNTDDRPILEFHAARNQLTGIRD